MSRTVDNRVVEMQFNNKQFEQGIAESRQSLKQLDKDLQFENASQGLMNLNQAFDKLDLSNIENGVMSLQDRFSAFGIFSMQVIERLSNALINFATNSVGKVFDQIVSGGMTRAMNIENARFSLQGLLNDGQKVQEVMDIALESVNDTAYGFDEAAKAASMFVTTGMSNTQLANSLRALAGVTAQTNSDYSRMADIFTTVAGNGRLMGQQLTQLSYYGLNAAEYIAKYINKHDEIRKQLKLTHAATESDIRDLVSKGKISFKIFSDAMEEAFGSHAKDANKTFTGAMSNIKAALSRIGDKFIRPLIEQEGPLVNMFNRIREAINAVNKLLDPYVDIFVTTATKVAKVVEDFFKTIADAIGDGSGFAVLRLDIFMSALADVLFVCKWTFDRLIEVIQKFFKLPSIKKLNDIIRAFKEFTTQIRFSLHTADGLSKVFGGLTNVINIFLTAFNIAKKVFLSAFKIVEHVITSLTPLGDQLLEILGYFNDGVTGIDNWVDSTKILDKVVEKTIRILDPFLSLITSVYTIIKNTFKSGGGGAGGIINAFFGVITRSITTVMHSIEELLDIDLSEQIGWVINKLTDLKNLVMVLAPFFNEFISFFGDLGKIIYNSFEGSGFLEGLVNVIFNVLTRAVTTLMHAFEDLTGINVSRYIGNVINFFKKAKETVLGTRDGIQELKNAIKSKWNSVEFEGLRNLFENLKTTFINVRNTISNGVDDMNTKLGGLDFSGVGGFFEGFFKVILGLGNVVGVVLDSVWSAISPFITDLTSALSEGDIQKVSDIFTALLSILAGIRGYQAYDAGIGAIITLFTDKQNGIFGFFDRMTELLKSLNNASKLPTTISAFLNQQTQGLRFKQIEAFAASVLMLAGSAYLISKIPEEDLARSLTALYTMVTALAGIIGELSVVQTPGKGFAAPMLALGVSILLLAAAMKVLSKIDPDALTNSFTAVIGLLTGVTAAVTAMTAVEGSLKKVPGAMIALAVAVLLLAVSLKMLAKLDPDSLQMGFIAITGLIADITGALIALMAVSSSGGNLKKASGAILAIGIAVLIMAASLAVLTKMDQDALAKSFAVMSGMLLEVVAALVILGLMGKNDASIGKAAATMLIAAVAIAILGAALAKLTNDINPDNAAAALIVLGLALAELAIALTFMQDSASGAAALLIASVALLLLAAAFKTIAELNPDQILAGILAMAAALGILIAAVLALTLIPGGAAVLLAIAAALLMVGLAFMAIGAGIALIGVGMMLIIAAIIALGALSVAAISNALASFAALLQGLRVIIPLIAAVITDLIIAIIKNLGAQMGVIIDTIKTLCLKILDMIIALLPDIAIVLLMLLDLVFDILEMAIPRLIDILTILLENVLTFLEWGVPRLIEFVLNLLMGIWDVLGVKIPELADHAAGLIINCINGLAEVIREREPELKEAINNLIQAVLDAILDMLGLAPGSEPVGDAIFMDFIAKMCVGIESKKMELWYKLTEMIREAINKVKEKFRESFDIGKNFIQGLINGIGSKIGDLLDTVGNAGADVIEALVNVFQTHSPSKVTEKIGEYVDMGLINGIEKLSGSMAKAAERSGYGVINQFSKTMDMVYDIVNSDMDFSPTITPILDSSELEEGMNNIGGMLSNYGISASGSYNIASNLDSESDKSEEIQNEQGSQTIVNFTQNNNSPKSLDRIEIYRDTKNMLNNPSLSSLF